MAVIHNTLYRVGGTPVSGARVLVSLSWDKDTSPVIKEDTNDFMVPRPTVVYTDIHGRWEMDVVTNTSLVPSTSVYRIIETTAQTDEDTEDDHDLSVVYYVTVSTDGWVGDMIVPTPAWEV